MYYHGRSIGRMIEYLNEICGCHIASRVVFKDEKIWNGSEVFATCSFKRREGVEYPHFTFYDYPDGAYKNRQRCLHVAQNGNMWHFRELISEAVYERDQQRDRIERGAKRLSENMDRNKKLKEFAAHWNVVFAHELLNEVL